MTSTELYSKRTSIARGISGSQTHLVSFAQGHQYNFTTKGYEWHVLIIIISLQQRGSGYSNTTVCLWMGEWVGAFVRPLRLALWAQYRLQFFFCWSLSNLTCEFLMIRGETLLILRHGVKVQGRIWIFVLKTLEAWHKLQFLLNYFQTSNISWGRRNPFHFCVTGSTVKVNSHSIYKTLGVIRTTVFALLLSIFTH